MRFVGYAQEAFTIKCSICKQSTFERIADVTITNQNSHTAVSSNELGQCTIKAKKGDTLLISKVGFASQKQAVTGQNELFIYLQPTTNLSEVTIVGTSSRQEFNDVINNYRKKGLYFDGRPPLAVFSPLGGSPLTGLYELFGKDAAREKRFIKFSKNEMEAIQVNRRYTKQLVKQVTALTDSDAVIFMQQYRPAYADIKKWSDYELIAYIKEQFKVYSEHKGDTSIQPLYKN